MGPVDFSGLLYMGIIIGALIAAGVYLVIWLFGWKIFLAIIVGALVMNGLRVSLS